MKNTPLSKAVLVVIFSFAGLFLSCSKQTPPVESGLLKVLSTTAMIDDVVSQVGGERIEHSVLVMGAIDPHSYELVKGDDEKIDEARIVFYNGLNLEHGASLRYKISQHPHEVSLGSYVLKNYPELILFEGGELDPHIWMDVSLWSKIIDPIVEALSLEDPEGMLYYTSRGALLKEELMAFHCSLRDRLQAIPESRRYLVTSHDAFGYFTRSYLASNEELLTNTWRKRFKAPEGLSPDGQLGAVDLQKIIDHLIENQIEIVFPESNVSRDSLKKIVIACKEKKTQVRFSTDTLYGDCMGESGSFEGTYKGMIEHNGSVLIKEWEQH